MMPVLCVEPVRPLDRTEQERVRGELLDRGAGFSHTGGSRRSSSTRRFPWTSATTPRSSARSWRSGPRGNCDDGRPRRTGSGHRAAVGFWGRRSSACCAQRGQAVRSLARQPLSPSSTRSEVDRFRATWPTSAIVSGRSRAAATVFHVAAKAGLWGPYPSTTSSNVVGTENVIAACRKHGVRRLIYTSSPSVVFTGHDLEGVDESIPYANAVRRGLSGDQGDRREAGPGEQRCDAGHGLACART